MSFNQKVHVALGVLFGIVSVSFLTLARKVDG